MTREPLMLRRITAIPLRLDLRGVFLFVSVLLVSGRTSPVRAQAVAATQPSVTPAEAAAFQQDVQPLLQKFCVRCHNPDDMKSGVRVDQLSAAVEDRQIPLLKGIQRQLADGAMPPEDEPQPTAEQRRTLEDWLTRAITAARARDTQRNGVVRRLTVTQYDHTLRDLLGLQEKLTDILPPDGVSKDGFANNVQTLGLSPLQVEAYFDIASQALDRCVVDESKPPVVQTFRMEFGESINREPCPDRLILGANSELLRNQDFVVTEPRPTKTFAYHPFAMRTKFDFIEGYAGNDTVRGWRKYDSIYHAVFACVRGTPGYPKGLPHQVVPQGLLLRPAIPSPEIFGQSNTYGPMANFKISLRELPEEGNFRVTVRAARYDDGLLLDAGAKPAAPADSAISVTSFGPDAPAIKVATEGVYQIDVYRAPGSPQSSVTLGLAEQRFTGRLYESPVPAAKPADDAAAPDLGAAFLVVNLPRGEIKLTVADTDASRLRRIVLTRLADDNELARRFKTFAQRTPSLGVHVGLRRDCGSTLTAVGLPQTVRDGEVREYVFEGAIRDFPSPDVERDNVNYLAGIREIGVRSEFTDGRDMPRLLIRSIEFEGPYYTAWPPPAHRAIFIDSPHRDDPAAYARDILRSFATRAYRRPVTDDELAALLRVWNDSRAAGASFSTSIKDALLVTLTSPQFLFLIEKSASPAAEDLDAYELASKLSYFLWNSPPDQRLLDLAAQNALRQSLDDELVRMIRDPRFGRAVQEFASQWFSLDKFDVVSVDAKRFPRLTRDAKTELRREPVEFLRYLVEQNLPVRNLVQSDFVIANEVVANYYGLGSRTESGFRFLPIKHDNEHLGGVLTQASVLSGLSNGREANPIKRGSWLARKIVAEPPDDPPPNVPQIKEDDGEKLSLRQKLERHRNQRGCAKCHAGIDPWGLPFEEYDAAGIWKQTPVAELQSRLPDGAEVMGVNGLKSYLVRDRIDQVAFSFAKHAASYACGRDLSYNELEKLREQLQSLRGTDYRLQDVLRLVIKSDTFLKK